MAFVYNKLLCENKRHIKILSEFKIDFMWSAFSYPNGRLLITLRNMLTSVAQALKRPAITLWSFLPRCRPYFASITPPNFVSLAMGTNAFR